MQYAVVADHFDAWDVELLAPVFRRHLGLVAYDARHKARRARGILADELTRDRADAIAAALAGECPVAVVEQPFAAKLGRPRSVRRLRCDPAGLVLALGHGEPHAVDRHVPWEYVELVSGGAVHVVERAEEGVVPSTDGLQNAPGNVFRSNTRTEEYDEIRADVVTRGLPGGDLHARLVATQLVYADILGEEAIARPDESASAVARDNFRLVLARIGRLAAWADVPPPTVALIASEHLHLKPPESASFAGDAEFDAYNRWRLARRRAFDGPA